MPLFKDELHRKSVSSKPWKRIQPERSVRGVCIRNLAATNAQHVHKRFGSPTNTLEAFLYCFRPFVGITQFKCHLLRVTNHVDKYLYPLPPSSVHAVAGVQLPARMLDGSRSKPEEAQLPTVCDPWPASRYAAEIVQKVGHHMSVVRNRSGAVRTRPRPAHPAAVRQNGRPRHSVCVQYAVPFGSVSISLE